MVSNHSRLEVLSYYTLLYLLFSPCPVDTFGLRVGNCFAFDKKNITLKLTDDRG